jgi:hypothetical protein
MEIKVVCVIRRVTMRMINPNVVNAIYHVWIVQVLTRKIVWNVKLIDTI